MKSVFLFIAIALYDLTLIGGTAYLVQVYGWSMWTFVLTVLFFISPGGSEKSSGAN